MVYLNMTDHNTNRPFCWRLNSYSKRTCGRINRNSYSCDSAFSPVIGGEYTSVCGSIRAYQKDQTDAFETFIKRRIIRAYFSGVSLAHGQHIWTFVAAATQSSTNDEGCPCIGASFVATPSFVGEDYFCDSGVHLVASIQMILSGMVKVAVAVDG